MPKHRQINQLAVLAGVLTAFLVLVDLMLMKPRISVKAPALAEGALILSNGQSIKIGESRANLLKDVGGSLRTVNPGLFQYPGDPQKPVEVSVYIEDDKVTGLNVSKGEQNRESLTGAGINSNTQWLVASNKLGLTPINMQQDAVKRKGYKFSEGSVTTYLMTPTCGGGDQVVTILMVLNGYTAPLNLFSEEPACLSGGGGTKPLPEGVIK